MSNSSEQNGRRTTPHQQPSAPKDPRTRKGLPSGAATSSGDSKTICRDYIWGICAKGVECKYKHELEYNSMRATLKFCHNFQNRGACDWPDCTYLHISRDEENLFVTTGQIPRMLASRYAVMSVYEYMAPPPPPPVPPVPVSAPSLVPAAALLAPPPPPPPPTTTTTAARNVPPIYTAHPPAQQVVPASMPPPSLPVMFDPSRPPPPLPTKRRASDAIEAETPSKLSKVDDPDILCDNCIQRELRLKVYTQEMEKIQQEEEKRRLILKKKLEDYQNGKLLLRSILSPKWFCIFDNYIEGTNQGNNLISQPSSLFVSETSTVPRQFLLQLVEHIVGSANSRNILESVQSTSRESSLLESLSSLGRRNSATTSSSPDMLHALLKALRPSSAESEQRVPGEQRTVSERASGGADNVLTRLANSGAPSGSGVMPVPAPYASSSTPYAPSSTSVGHVPAPTRPFYAQPYRPPVPPSASAPQCVSQPHPQPYYAQQYAGVSGSAAQYAAAALPYPSGSSVTPQYPPTGADSGTSQQMHNGRNYQYSDSYPSYYPTAPPYQ